MSTFIIAFRRFAVCLIHSTKHLLRFHAKMSTPSLKPSHDINGTAIAKMVTAADAAICYKLMVMLPPREFDTDLSMLKLLTNSTMY